tara:strand:+ start:124 stop:576 length:453 start_codon:yes stop_codon:yes gene_type:complete
MTTQKEREVYSTATKLIIQEACNNDTAAIHYLWKLMCISRTVDDIYDEDQEVSRDQLIETVEYLLVGLPSNPFFRKHRDILESQHISMYNAWMAANLWEKGDETDKIYSHVWRDTHHEIVPLVALLTQGPTKMTEVSLKIRKLFKKQLGE